MKVVATKRGYYNGLREPGDLFDIADEKAFSEKWMRKATKEEVKEAEKAHQEEGDANAKSSEPEKASK